MSDRIRAAMAEYVGSGALPGAAWWVSRDGDVSRGELGTSHPRGAGEPVRPDTLFRISSTTKPITAVVAMTLVDDGTLSLDDPVERWLPELADRQVLVDPEGDLTHTVPGEPADPRPGRARVPARPGLRLQRRADPGARRAGAGGRPHGSTRATGQPRPGRVDGAVRTDAADVPAGRALAVQHRRRGSRRARRPRLRLDVPRPAAPTRARSTGHERHRLQRGAGGPGPVGTACGRPGRTVATRPCTTRPTGSGAGRPHSPTAPTGWSRRWTTWRRSGRCC